MNPFETIQLAFTAIIANRLRSLLTMLGIVIGVMSVIILVAMVTGLQTYITSQISSFGSNLIFVIPGTVGGGRGPGGAQVNRIEIQDALALKNKIGSDALISSVVQKVGTVKYSNKTSKNVSFFGVESSYFKIITAIKIKKGRIFSQSESDGGKKVALIGTTVASTLFKNSDPIGQQIILGSVRYQVIGIVDERGSTFGSDQDNAVYVPLTALKTQYGINNLNGIYVSTDTAEQIGPLQNKIKEVLLKRLAEEDFTVSTQEQALETISQITGVLTIALGGIAAISLIVGGIGVSNIMLVSVTERTREIGLRKALGAKPSDIRNQFLIEAVTLCALGGVIGILLGYLISSIISNFFTTTVPLWSVALSFGFSMVVGIIFGVAPAIRAARLDPIQALRYE
jgi:putative ABC transport system permease protein